MIEKLRMCFMGGDLARTGREKSAAEYTFYRVLIEKMLANDRTLELDHRDVGPVLFVPFGARIDIPNLDLETPRDERPQFVDEHVAQVASLAAVDDDDSHFSRRPVSMSRPA